MQFKHEEDGLKIEFSWKEIFNIIKYKSLSFNRKSTYMFYTHFMRLISEGITKYGDSKKHGLIKEDEEVKTKSL